MRDIERKSEESSLRQLVRKYQRHLGLSHWSIRTQLVLEKDHISEAVASIAIYPARQEAYLRVIENWQEYESSLDLIVLHELCHLIISPYGEVLVPMVKRHLPETEFHTYEHLSEIQEESACNNLSRVLLKLIKKGNL